MHMILELAGRNYFALCSFIGEITKKFIKKITLNDPFIDNTVTDIILDFIHFKMWLHWVNETDHINTEP